MIVYLIRNLVNGKGYVGQTIRPFAERWANHLCDALSGSLLPLHAAIRKYGENNFEFCTLTEAENLDELNSLEIHHTVKQGTLAPNGYNLKIGGKHGTYSQQSRSKMSAAKIGNKCHLGCLHSEETRNKMRGHKVSSETRARISAMLMGKKLSPERRAKISKGLIGNKRSLGYHPSPESRAKISAALKGKKKPPFTAEQRANISAAHKGLSPWNKGKKTGQVPWNKGKKLIPGPPEKKQ